MIELADFLNTAESVLKQERLKQALETMHESPYQARKRVGLFGERFDYNAEFDQIIAFSAAYLETPADTVLGYVRYIDRKSPLELMFALAFMLYGYSSLDALYIDGHKIPSEKAATDTATPKVVSIYSQFPVRFGAFRRDVDFIVEVGTDELAVEIDGSSFHSSAYALQRDLSTEIIFQAAHIPIVRIASSSIQFHCFERVQALCDKRFNPPQYQTYEVPPQRKEFFHSIEVFPKPRCMVTLIARILDYYFDSLVISSIRFKEQEGDEAQPDEPGPMSAYQLPLKPNHYVSFTLKYDAMQAHINVDGQGVHITSPLLSTQHVLLLALIWGITSIENRALNSYDIDVIDHDTPDYAVTALFGSKVGHLKSRTSLLSALANRKETDMYESESEWSPTYRFNQQALDCPDIDITPSFGTEADSPIMAPDRHTSIGKALRYEKDNFLLHQHLRRRLPRHYEAPNRAYAKVVMEAAANHQRKKQSYLAVCRQSPQNTLGGYLAYFYEGEEDVELLFPLDKQRHAVIIDEAVFKDMCVKHDLPWAPKKNVRLVDCVFNALPHNKDYPALWDYSDEAGVVWVHVSQLGHIDLGEPYPG